jgi:potassium large conductance calcium-activated channel subfamily M alpha protein 1
MPSVGSNQMLNSIQTKQVNKVKPNVNRQPPDNVIVSPSSYNR